jgi:hypothetical protein
MVTCLRAPRFLQATKFRDAALPIFKSSASSAPLRFKDFGVGMCTRSENCVKKGRSITEVIDFYASPDLRSIATQIVQANFCESGRSHGDKVLRFRIATGASGAAGAGSSDLLSRGWGIGRVSARKYQLGEMDLSQRPAEPKHVG